MAVSRQVLNIKHAQKGHLVDFVLDGL